MPGNWKLDQGNSEVSLVIKHSGSSKVRAFFETVEADLIIHDDRTGDVNVVIGTDSFSSRNSSRDKRIKSSDFLDTENYPEITFKTISLEPISNSFKLLGELTILGLKKTVILDTECSNQVVDTSGHRQVAFSASTIISRKDFGLSWKKVFETGGVLLGDKVSIEIKAIFVLEGETFT